MPPGPTKIASTQNCHCAFIKHNTVIPQSADSGVGHIHIVDFDIVEPSNLNRQNYRIKDLGQIQKQRH